MVFLVSRFLMFMLSCLWLPMSQAETAETKPLVVLTTNLGAITIELNADKAPLSVANFLAYVDSGFYINTLFFKYNSFFTRGVFCFLTPNTTTQNDFKTLTF